VLNNSPRSSGFRIINHTCLRVSGLVENVWVCILTGSG
jgi:hypothetical protein